MTQEEKELLIKDLCSRLQYEIKAWEDNEYPPFTIIGYDGTDFIDNDGWEHRIGTFKPYLRPMSSMTEEEEIEFEKIFELELKALESPEGHTIESAASSVFAIDFYNKYHFDYRGLIEKGLAIAVTENNNPYKE